MGPQDLRVNNILFAITKSEKRHETCEPASLNRNKKTGERLAPVQVVIKD